MNRDDDVALHITISSPPLPLHHNTSPPLLDRKSVPTTVLEGKDRVWDPPADPWFLETTYLEAMIFDRLGASIKCVCPGVRFRIAIHNLFVEAGLVIAVARSGGARALGGRRRGRVGGDVGFWDVSCGALWVLSRRPSCVGGLSRCLVVVCARDAGCRTCCVPWSPF